MSDSLLFMVVHLRLTVNERSIDTAGLLDLPQGTSRLRIRALH